MFRYILSFITLWLSFSCSANSFEKDQKRYSRVREAYAQKEQSMIAKTVAMGVKLDSINVYLRAFKQEGILELWVKNRSDKTYKLLKEYEICASSGEIGPKRQRGDLQVPEGFYFIDRFNPYSNFHLSMGVNYPNKSDRILGVQGRLGGDIFIHGACATIGCIPITDEEIKELYVYCVKAKNAGQNKIPVTIFPAKLDTIIFEDLTTQYIGSKGKVRLWTELEKAYTLFNQTKTLPTITFKSDGSHIVK